GRHKSARGSAKRRTPRTPPWVWNFIRELVFASWMALREKMPKYMIEINGRNFLVAMEDRIAKHGFFTLRFVEAADPEAAEEAAVRMIRETRSLRDLVQNSSEDPPVMDVTGIEEMESFEAVETLEPGLIWYEENARRRWEFWKR